MAEGVLRQLLAVFTFEVDTKELEKGKNKVGSILKDMQNVAQAFAGGMIAKAVGGFIKDTVDEMMQIRRGAAELKIATDEYQGLQYAAKAAGLDTRTLAMSIERLQVNVERAARGGKNQAASMHLLGLTTKDASGTTKSATELFLDAADGISKMTDANKQAIAVRDLFGIGGHRLLPVLRMGRKAIEELMDITKEYGKYEAEVIEQSAHYTVTLIKLEATWRGVKSFIMSQWLPVLERQTDKVIKGAQWLMGLAKNSLVAAAALKVLQAAMLGLALKMAFAFPYATLLMAALAGLALVLDDIMVFFAGGDSVLGRALDKLFGKDAHVEILRSIKEAWAGFIDMLKDFGEWLRDHPELLMGLKLLAGAAVVGTKAVLPMKQVGSLSRAVDATRKEGATYEGADKLQWHRSEFTSARSASATDPQGEPAHTVRVSIGDIHVVAPPGASAKDHGKAVADAVDDRLSHHIKTAVAARRRESQQ